MIDRLVETSGAVTAQVEDEGPMKLEQLKLEHPELCDALRTEGVDCERKRVSAHIQAGRLCGDMELAATGISEGAQASDMMDKYMCARTASEAESSQADAGEGSSEEPNAETPPPMEARNEKRLEAFAEARRLNRR